MTGSFSRRLKFRDNFPHSCTAAGLHGLMRSGRLLIDKIFYIAVIDLSQNLRGTNPIGRHHLWQPHAARR